MPSRPRFPGKGRTRASDTGGLRLTVIRDDVTHVPHGSELASPIVWDWSGGPCVLETLEVMAGEWRALGGTGRKSGRLVSVAHHAIAGQER